MVSTLHSLLAEAGADLGAVLAQTRPPPPPSPETPLVQTAPLTVWIMATVHVLTATAWLGLDAAMVGAALLVRRRDLNLEVRVTFDRLRRWLELGPWATVILSIPLVLTLVWMNGYGFDGLTAGPFLSLSANAAVWLGGVVFVVAADLGRPGGGGPDRAALLNRIDTGLRFLVAGAFLVLGVMSLVSPGPLYNTKYAWKSTVFALVIMLGWWARQAGRGITATLATVAAGQQDGGIDRRAEATLSSQIGRMVVPAVLSWLGIVVAVGLSVTG